MQARIFVGRLVILLGERAVKATVHCQRIIEERSTLAKRKSTNVARYGARSFVSGLVPIEAWLL